MIVCLCVSIFLAFYFCSIARDDCNPRRSEGPSNVRANMPIGGFLFESAAETFTTAQTTRARAKSMRIIM